MRICGTEELRALGKRLADEAKPGDVYAFVGDLGAGKTTLAKAIAEGLGVLESVTSPTFTILQIYESGRLPLYHFDVYRVDDPAEMDELDYEDYFFGNGLTVIEWADKIEPLLPETARIFYFSYGAREDERVITERNRGA